MVVATRYTLPHAMALAAIAGVLVSMGLLLLGVVTLLWNKLDKRFDDLEAMEPLENQVEGRDRRECGEICS